MRNFIAVFVVTALMITVFHSLAATPSIDEDSGSFTKSIDWIVEIVDDYYAGITSIAVDSGDHPHIAYYDGFSNDLKYAYYDGSEWDGYVVESVGGMSGGGYGSLALDNSDHPHIIYYDKSNYYLKYTYYDGVLWHTETVDSTIGAGTYGSLALDSDDHPHIAYYRYIDISPPTGDLKYAYYDGLWHRETVDTGGSVGADCSVALDSSNHPHISYVDNTNHYLKYAYHDGSAWHIEVVDTGEGHWGIACDTSIAVDSGDHPHISYHDSENMNLKYAYHDGLTWHTITIDNSGDMGKWNSLALDSGDHPHIAYVEHPSQFSIRYAHYEGGIWYKETVETLNDGGYGTSIAVDSGDHPHISYHTEFDDKLKYACPSSLRPYDVTIEAFNPVIGPYVSVSIKMDGSPSGYSTPHTFTGLTGAHEFEVPGVEPGGHRFSHWSTGETTTYITVSYPPPPSGIYTAYYGEYHTLQIIQTIGGTTDPSPGMYYFLVGAQVSVEAIPFADYYFNHWVLDGSWYYSNPIDVEMDSDHNLRAIFYSSPPPPPTEPPHDSGLPKVDDIFFKGYPCADPEVIVDEFITGETDWIEGPTRVDLYQSVFDAGHTISEMDPMASISLLAINCRDYKSTSGEPNMPLNDSMFRISLSYIYGMDDKEADVFSYVGAPWCYAAGNPVPAAQEPWYDEATVMPNTDYDMAWSILQSEGYTIDGDGWLAKDGQKIRNMTVLCPCSSGLGTSCEHKNGGGFPYFEKPLCGGAEGPAGGFVRNFNEFIAYIGAVGPTMDIQHHGFSQLVTELMVVRDYDFINIGLTGLGRFVDWLYLLHHSSNDVLEGWNFVGINDTQFDTWTETISTSLDVNEIIWATEDFTRKFVYELMPWLPMCACMGFCTTANNTRGELTNLISMYLYGPSNGYSWMCLHWRGTPDITWPGDHYARAIEDEAQTLNPWTENSLYGWQIMGRVLDGLLACNPDTMSDIPWIATNWTVEQRTSIPELGIDSGTTVTFHIRQNVTWHDGYPVTAYDCVANMRFMREHKPPRYSKVWEHLVYEEAKGPYKFNVYFDETSLYYANYVSETCLLVPAHIIEIVEGYWETWDPSQLDYADLGLGLPPSEYPFLTQLVGCGPFVFDYYNRALSTGHITRYKEYFVNAPVISSVAGEWRIDPGDDYSYQPLIQNVAAKEADEKGTLTSVTVDVVCYNDGVLNYILHNMTLGPWDWTYLGFCTIPSALCGLHNITVVATGDGFTHTYTHQYVATLREDLTTYTGELIDFKVDMRDLGWVCRAFGSFPGHLRWDPACDVNDDFRIDMRDIGRIARRFGWTC